MDVLEGEVIEPHELEIYFHRIMLMNSETFAWNGRSMYALKKLKLNGMVYLHSGPVADMIAEDHPNHWHLELFQHTNAALQDLSSIVPILWSREDDDPYYQVADGQTLMPLTHVIKAKEPGFWFFDALGKTSVRFDGPIDDDSKVNFQILTLWYHKKALEIEIKEMEKYIRDRLD